MRPPFYLRQLKQDLEVWIAKGLVPAGSRDAILASVGAGFRRHAGSTSSSPSSASSSSAPARCRSSPRIGRRWKNSPASSCCSAACGQPTPSPSGSWQTDRDAIGQAFVLLGIILFGTNIWFIAQTYNINAHYPDGTLLWGLGAIAAAALVPSRPALAIALALGGLWTWQETQDFGHVLHAPFLVYWAACAALAWFLNWRPGVHLSALTLIFWLAINFESLSRLLGWGDAEILTIYIFAPLALWSVSQLFERDANGLALTVGHYAFFFFLVAYALLHHTDMHRSLAEHSLVGLRGHPEPGRDRQRCSSGIGRNVFSVIDALATVVRLRDRRWPTSSRSAPAATTLDVPYRVGSLIIILWSLSRGVRFDDRFVINLSIVAFGAWFLYTYFEMFSALMDKAIFFIVGGVVLIALSLGLENIRRRLIAAAKARCAKGAAQ